MLSPYLCSNKHTTVYIFIDVALRCLPVGWLASRTVTDLAEEHSVYTVRDHRTSTCIEHTQFLDNMESCEARLGLCLPCAFSSFQNSSKCHVSFTMVCCETVA